VAYPGRTTLIAIRCEYTPVAFKVNLSLYLREEISFHLLSIFYSFAYE